MIPNIPSFRNLFSIIFTTPLKSCSIIHALLLQMEQVLISGSSLPSSFAFYASYIGFLLYQILKDGIPIKFSFHKARNLLDCLENADTEPGQYLPNLPVGIGAFAGFLHMPHVGICTDSHVIRSHQKQQTVQFRFLPDKTVIHILSIRITPPFAWRAQTTIV